MIGKLLKEITAQHPDYGFDKAFPMIQQKGYRFNHKRVHRVYCELNLNIRIKPKKRLAPRTAIKLAHPEQANQCWSLDYMSDSLISGRRFRTANVIDDHNREVLGILVSHSLPSMRITRWLDRLAERRGYPARIRVDNGPENIASHFKDWANQHGVTVQYIQPGKPAQNAYIERFNRTYRQAILNMYLFNDVEQVQRLTNDWIKHYNEERPHEALNNLTPKQYLQKSNDNFSIKALG